MSLLYDLAAAVNEFMDSGPSWFVGLLLVPIVGMPLVLLHELGHAFAARRLLGARVDVVTGSWGKLAQFELDRIRVEINAVTPLLGVGGTASFEDSGARARDIVWIALAGPAASLLGTIVTAVALGTVAQGGALHALLWSATLLGGTFVVLNLVPFALDGDTPSDGQQALDAWRIMRMIEG